MIREDFNIEYQRESIGTIRGYIPKEGQKSKRIGALSGAGCQPLKYGAVFGVHYWLSDIGPKILTSSLGTTVCAAPHPYAQILTNFLYSISSTYSIEN